MNYNIIGIIVNCIVFGLIAIGFLFGIIRGLRKTVTRTIGLLITGLLLLVVSIFISNLIVTINFSFLKIEGFTTIDAFVKTFITNQFPSINASEISQSVKFVAVIINPIVFILLFWIFKYLLLPLNYLVYKLIYGKREKLSKIKLKEWEQNQKIYTKEVELKAISNASTDKEKLKTKLDIIDIKQMPKVMKKNRLLGGVVGIVCGLVVVGFTLLPVYGALETVKKLDTHKAVIFTQDVNEKDGYIKFITNGESDKIFNVLDKNAGINLIKYTGVGLISNLGFRQLTSTTIKKGNSNYAIHLTDDLEKLVSAIDSALPLALTSYNKPYTKEQLRSYIKSAKNTLLNLKDVNTILVMGDLLVPVAIDYIDQNNIINVGNNATNDIIKTALKTLKVKNMENIYAELNSLMDTFDILNNNELLSPLLNSEVNATNINDYLKRFDNKLIGGGRVIDRVVSNILSMDTATAVMPKLINLGLTKIDSMINFGYVENKTLTAKEVKDTISNLIISAFDSYINFDINQISLNQKGLDKIKLNLNNVSKILDIAKNTPILNESVADSLINYKDTNYYKLIKKCETYANNYLKKLLPDYLVDDVSGIIGNIKEVESWPNEIKNIDTIVSKLYPYFYDGNKNIKEIKSQFNINLLNKIMAKPGYEDELEEVFTAFANTKLLSADTKVKVNNVEKTVPLYAKILSHQIGGIRYLLPKDVDFNIVFEKIQENILNANYKTVVSDKTKSYIGQEIKKLFPFLNEAKLVYEQNKGATLKVENISSILTTFSEKQVNGKFIINTAIDSMFFSGDVMKTALTCAINYTKDKKIVKIDDTILNEIITSINSINNETVIWNKELNCLSEVVELATLGVDGIIGSATELSSQVINVSKTGDTLDKITKSDADNYKSQIITDSVVRRVLNQSIVNALEKDATGTIVADDVSLINKILNQVSIKLIGDKITGAGKIENIFYKDELCSFIMLININKNGVSLNNLLNIGINLDCITFGGAIVDSTNVSTGINIGKSKLILNEDINNIIVMNIETLKIKDSTGVITTGLDGALNKALDDIKTKMSLLKDNADINKSDFKPQFWSREFGNLLSLNDYKSVDLNNLKKDSYNSDGSIKENGTLRGMGISLDNIVLNSKIIDNIIIKELFTSILNASKNEIVISSDLEITNALKSLVGGISANLGNLDNTMVTKNFWSKELGHLQKLIDLKDSFSLNIDTILGAATVTENGLIFTNSGIGGALDNICNCTSKELNSLLIVKDDIDTFLATIIDKKFALPNLVGFGELNSLKVKLLANINDKINNTDSYKLELQSMGYLINDVFVKDVNNNYPDFSEISKFTEYGKKFDKIIQSKFIGFAGKEILLLAIDVINFGGYDKTNKDDLDILSSIKANIEKIVIPTNNVLKLSCNEAYSKVENIVANLPKSSDISINMSDLNSVKNSFSKIDAMLGNLQVNSICGNKTTKMIAVKLLNMVGGNIDSQIQIGNIPLTKSYVVEYVKFLKISINDDKDLPIQYNNGSAIHANIYSAGTPITSSIEFRPFQSIANLLSGI